MMLTEQSVSFLLNAPDPTTDTSWVQLAKTGSFTDPRYGKFKITLADFQKWIENFKQLSTGADSLGIPVDVDHSPEKRGDTEAVGWVKQLEQRSTELWGLVEWNELGKELVGERRYAYISPSYSPDYKDETGKSYGTALVGIALTNRPFLRMATVNLSQASFAHVDEEPPPAPAPVQPPYSRRQMELDTILTTLSLSRETLGVSADADDATVLTALAAHQAKQSAAPPAPAIPEGHVVLSAEQVQKLTTQAASGAAAAEQLRVSTFETAFNEAQKAGKVVLAQKDGFREMYDVTADNTLKLLDGLQPVLTMQPRGAGGSNSDLEPAVQLLAGEYTDPLTNMSIDQEGLKVLARAGEIQARDNVSFERAIQLAEAGGN